MCSHIAHMCSCSGKMRNQGKLIHIIHGWWHICFHSMRSSVCALSAHKNKYALLNWKQNTKTKTRIPIAPTEKRGNRRWVETSRAHHLQCLCTVNRIEEREYEKTKKTNIVISHLINLKKLWITEEANELYLLYIWSQCQSPRIINCGSFCALGEWVCAAARTRLQMKDGRWREWKKI